MNGAPFGGAWGQGILIVEDRRAVQVNGNGRRGCRRGHGRRRARARAMARAAPKDGADAPARVAQMLVRPRCVILLGRNLPLIRNERGGAIDGAGAQPPSPLPAHLLDVPGRYVDVPPPVFGIVCEAVLPIERLRIMRWRILLTNLRICGGKRAPICTVCRLGALSLSAAATIW